MDKKTIIILISILLVLLVIVGLFLNKSFNKKNDNSEGDSASIEDENTGDDDEYCEIDWHDNVILSDGWEIGSVDDENISAKPDDRVPVVGDYIILWDKYGVAYAKKVNKITDLQDGQYQFGLLDVDDPSEIIDKISFSGSGDFSTLLGGESSDITGAINDTQKKRGIDIPMSKVSAEAHSITVGTIKYELAGNIAKDGSVNLDVKRTVKGGNLPETEFSAEETSMQDESDSSEELRISGSFTIEDLTVHADGNIDFSALNQSKLEAGISANEILALEVSGKREDKIGLGAIPIPIAVTGGVVNVSIEPYLVFDMEGKVTVEYKIVGTRFDAYMDLSKSGPDFSKSTLGTPQDPQITVSTEIGAGLRVSADLQVVKTSIVDPYIEFDAKVTGTKNPVVKGWENVPPCFDANFGFPVIKAGCDFMEGAPFADKVKQAAGWDMSLETTLLSADNAPLKIAGHFETDEDTSEVVITPDGKCTHNERDLKEFQVVRQFESNGADYYLSNTESEKYFEGQNNSYDVGDLIMDKDGNIEVLANNVMSNLITDEDILYYTVCNDDHNTIFMRDLYTGKEKRVKTGKNIGALGRMGNYLYYGVYNLGHGYGGGADVYAYDINTKKKTKMAKDIGKLQYYKGKVILQGDHSDTDNTATYLFDMDGNNKKRLDDSMICSINDGYIFCIVLRYNEDYSMDEKMIRYTMDGGEKETIIDWTRDHSQVQIPESEAIWCGI